MLRYWEWELNPPPSGDVTRIVPFFSMRFKWRNLPLSPFLGRLFCSANQVIFTLYFVFLRRVPNLIKMVLAHLNETGVIGPYYR
jgi:hypothetical protein